jgi:hypothetical protein
MKRRRKDQYVTKAFSGYGHSGMNRMSAVEFQNNQKTLKKQFTKAFHPPVNQTPNESIEKFSKNKFKNMFINEG